MTMVYPDYYNEFHCIADKCRHSCCVGWEIDIDSDTLDYYKGIGGKIGRDLRDNILENADGACFKTDDGERCPFLTEKGLCRLITELGEESLCDICAEHPRFYNEYESYTEAGLGLCCEEAARIILTQKEKMCLVADYEIGDEDRDFFDFKSGILNLLQDEALPLSEALEKMLALCGAKRLCVKENKLKALIPKLEFMGDILPVRLDWLHGDITTACADVKGFERELRHLAAYFVYRHVTGKESAGDKAYFAALNVSLVSALFAAEKDKTTEKLIDIARLYSAEIEYSDLNEDILIMK